MRERTPSLPPQSIPSFPTTSRYGDCGHTWATLRHCRRTAAAAFERDPGAHRCSWFGVLAIVARRLRRPEPGNQRDPNGNSADDHRPWREDGGDEHDSRDDRRDERPDAG